MPDDDFFIKDFNESTMHLEHIPREKINLDHLGKRKKEKELCVKMKLGHTACTFFLTRFLSSSLLSSLAQKKRKKNVFEPIALVTHTEYTEFSTTFSKLKFSFSLSFEYSHKLSDDVRTIIEWQYWKSRKNWKSNVWDSSFFSLVRFRCRRRRGCGCFIEWRRADTKIRVYVQCTVEYTRNRV